MAKRGQREVMMSFQTCLQPLLSFCALSRWPSIHFWQVFLQCQWCTAIAKLGWLGFCISSNLEKWGVYSWLLGCGKKFVWGSFGGWIIPKHVLLVTTARIGVMRQSIPDCLRTSTFNSSLHPVIYIIWKLTYLLAIDEHISTSFCWSPGHAGFPSGDQAYLLAKEVTSSEDSSPTIFP